jgi:hypothetical protein
MKHLILLIITALAIQSCVEIKFEEPQPKGIKNLEIFPEEFQGQYLLGDKDTLEIFKDGIKVLNDTTLEKDEFVISDQFIIREWKRNYFINIKEKEDSVWTLVVFKPTKKDFNLRNFSFKSDDLKKIKKLKKITETKEVKNKDGAVDYYLINPSRRELKKILKLFPEHDFGNMQKVK